MSSLGNQHSNTSGLEVGELKRRIAHALGLDTLLLSRDNRPRYDGR
jgi:hypothetical protein